MAGDARAPVTEIVITKVSLPVEFVAVIVKAVPASDAVAVPLILPLVVLNKIPLGGDGDIDHEDAAPPVFVGSNDDIAEFSVRLKLDNE